MYRIFSIVLICVYSGMNMAAKPIEVSPEYKMMAEEAFNADISPEMLKKVGSMMAVISSNEYQTKMANAQLAASEALGLEKNPYIRNKEEAPNLRQGNVIYIFISKSVPIETIRTYAADIAQFGNGILVLRGFVNGAGKAKPTAKFVHDIIKKDEYCVGTDCEVYNVEVQIDPVLFKRYRIKTVPALVYEDNAHFEGYCGLTESDINHVAEETDIIYGDASILQATKYLYNAKNSVGIKRIIDKLTPRIKG